MPRFTSNRYTLSILGFITIFAGTNSVFALPTIVSELDQNFDQNQGVESLDTITITEDAEVTAIKQGWIRVHIPDELEMIYDDERTQTELTVSGSAVDNGRVEANPSIEFSNGDKTFSVQVLEDFELGENLQISNLYVEGFHSSPSQSHPLWFTMNDEQEKYYDSKEIMIVTSSFSDTAAPEVPSNVSTTSVEDGMEITWADPTDLDLQWIYILKGATATSISATPLATIAPGVQSFTDEELDLDETAYYILRTTDGLNWSSGEEVLEVTRSAIVTDDTTDDSTDDSADDDTSDDDSTDDTSDDTTDDTTASEMFNDEIPEWAESAITVLATAGVVEGNPDGGFAASESLNRAEAAAMLWRVLMMGDPTGADVAPFTDVELGEWYTDYVSSLKGLELVAGNPDGSYEPGESINRAEFLQMAMNVYMYMQTEELADEAMAEAYADLDTSAWYAQVVSNATAWGFVEGSACEEGTCFNAGSEINRAEASQILYNMFW